MRVKISWKRFVGWVTGLRDKYASDLFFHTKCNVIALQVFFGIFLLLLVGLTYNYLYKDIIRTLLTGVTDILTKNSTANAQSIINSVEKVKMASLILVFVVIVTITSGVGYLLARLALRPTEEAFKSQKRFIADVAHELRTPLSVIKTNSEVALLDRSLDVRVKSILKSNVEELNRASEIINNLLSLSSFTRSGRMTFSAIDLGTIVDAAIKKLKAFAERKQIELTVKKSEPRTVWGNATALEQVVINLLKNAITFTPEGGLVSVEVEPNYQGNVLLTVRDNGIGISHKDLFRIFEPFYRAERSRNRRRGGSGLGLTIVSEIIKLHRGRITIKSALNQGTTAVVLLPFSQIAEGMETLHGRNEISVDFLRGNA